MGEVLRCPLTPKSLMYRLGALLVLDAVQGMRQKVEVLSQLFGRRIAPAPPFDLDPTPLLHNQSHLDESNTPRSDQAGATGSPQGPQTD